MDRAATDAARWPGPSPRRSHPLSCQRCAPGDVLLEKRLWMQPAAHATTVLDRLPQASQPVRLSFTVRVNARSHRSGATHPEQTLQAEPHGVVLLPWADGVPPLRCSAIAAAHSRDDHRRAACLTAVLSAEAPTLTVVASTEADPPLDGERASRSAGGFALAGGHRPPPERIRAPAASARSWRARVPPPPGIASPGPGRWRRCRGLGWS